MSETKKFNALLFDTRSIQRYIYSGNLLRTNIGASYIVDRLFFDVLVKDILKISDAEDTTWEIAEDEKKPWRNIKNCCVAYIGGGNALILFDASQEDKRREAVQKFSMRLLENFPGLKIGVAFGELNITGDELVKVENQMLRLSLKENQNLVFPAVNVPYTGLTLSCEINGEAADFCDSNYLVRPKENTESEVRFYSKETAIKTSFYKQANKNLAERFNKIFELKNSSERMENFEFPAKIDELGQKAGENYIAIVHVDGNNMGVKLRDYQNNLFELRRISREIRRKTEGAFADLLLKIIAAKKSGLFAEDLIFEDEKILPIRPLILGGDDVTFICPANMAILFTKTLMENLNSETPLNTAEHLTQKFSRQMDCCAGIAILPKSYPFFRGYKLTEQLCDEAKKSMRELPQKTSEGSSWLDFAILHGEQAPTLEQIRKREYTGARGNLHFGPYRIGNSNAKHKIERRNNIENLISCTEQFLESKSENPSPETISHGKIKELREILQHGEAETKKFLDQLKLQGKNFPHVEDWSDYVQNSLWSAEKNPRTPYVDAIELMDFYPQGVAEKWQNLK